MKKSTKILLWLLFGVPALILGIFALVKLYYFKIIRKRAAVNSEPVPAWSVYWKTSFKAIKIMAKAIKENTNGSLDPGGK